MLTDERLRELLMRLPEVEDVKVVVEATRFVAIVVAKRFQGVDEAVRQSEVWKLLLKELRAEELQRVDFVFTDTPEERASGT